MLKDRKISKKRGNENMKKFRKVIVALLAMVMALGCFAVTASADTTKVKVTVIWEEADGKSAAKADGIWICCAYM